MFALVGCPRWKKKKKEKEKSLGRAQFVVQELKQIYEMVRNKSLPCETHLLSRFSSFCVKEGCVCQLQHCYPISILHALFITISIQSGSQGSAGASPGCGQVVISPPHKPVITRCSHFTKF